MHDIKPGGVPRNLLGLLLATVALTAQEVGEAIRFIRLGGSGQRVLASNGSRFHTSSAV